MQQSGALRYRLAVKKATPTKRPQKLALRGQILRVLVDSDLSKVVGGIDSNDGRCAVVADSGAAACPTIPTR